MSRIKHKKGLRYLLTAIAAGVTVLTFTPVILDPGKINPRLFSMPYTLWTSICITILLVLLTYLVSKLQDNDK